MEKHIYQRVRTVAMAGLASAALLPTIALAEEERSGLSLLIPTMAEFIPACIAFVIVFLILSKMVWPVVVRSMAAREESVKVQIEAGDEAKRMLADTATQCQEELAKARGDSSEIVAKAKQEAEEERARIIYEAHVQANDIIEKGHKAVDSERAHAMEDLSRSVADLSVEIAGKIIGAELTDEEHLKLASRYLEEMENEDA